MTYLLLNSQTLAFATSHSRKDSRTVCLVVEWRQRNTSLVANRALLSWVMQYQLPTNADGSIGWTVLWISDGRATSAQRRDVRSWAVGSAGNMIRSGWEGWPWIRGTNTWGGISSWKDTEFAREKLEVCKDEGIAMWSTARRFIRRNGYGA